ncbi:Undecaprenyl-phosphate galactose phosphotransferase, WbaP [Desulfotomaculum nigrificans CO-1-SRB]|uniref:Undecaprenyl-phosphate galactose phosphotransferase, WbaP n=1 Tax=Desulfotomaculum nigrificans (strain DSM 14880 / VKM B-2319 / CO-1-SRB) TaxID=868595 RepID=F6B5K4_DESCC|nr:Undecaprenyl-phosphate galactose phosphotransferase, WbaP [Desulfotomaculum nigrificans CO-1-SRB]
MSGGPTITQQVEKTAYQNSRAPIMISNARTLLAIPALIIIDILAIIFSLLMACIMRTYILPSLLPGAFKMRLLASTLENLWWLPIILIICMAYEELYQKRLPYWKEVEKILRACTLAIVFTIAWLYLAKQSAEMSRTLVVISWATTIILIPLFRYWGKLTLIKTKIWNRPVIIVGAGKTGELITNALNREKTMGYSVIGYLDDNQSITCLPHPGTQKPIPVLGSFDDAEKIIATTGVQEVIVAAPGLPAQKLVELTNRLQPLVNNVMLIPDLFGLSMNGIEVEYFFDEQVLLLYVKNKLKSNLNRFIKRMFDLIAGSLLLVLTLPIMIIITAAIRLDSKGPAFFKQERMGQKGCQFTCYKFRTMYIEGDKILKRYLQSNPKAREEWQVFNKLKEYDPRVTRVGAILRRFSLDELPQLINVILGDMSLVGPRPYLPRERKQMGNWAPDIHVAKPGITGLWQVSGRNQIEFEGRLKLDTWYVRNWSLWLDVVLLLKTIKVVLRREGAY